MQKTAPHLLVRQLLRPFLSAAVTEASGSAMNCLARPPSSANGPKPRTRLTTIALMRRKLAPPKRSADPLYWKAVESRDESSRRLTRSAVKKIQAQGEGEEGIEVGLVEEGERVLLFSPPDQEANARREKKKMDWLELER